MKFRSSKQPSWLVSPSVSMTMAYGGVIACWFVYLSCTLMHPTIFHEGPYRSISTGAYWTFTGVNLFLSAWLLGSLPSARRAAHSNRRGLLAGIAVSLGFLVALQRGAQALHTDLNQRDRRGPEAIAAVIASHSGDGHLAVDYLREGLHAAYPNLEEAAFKGGLAYRNEGTYSHSLALSPSMLRLEFYGCSAPLPNSAGVPWSFERPAENRMAMIIPLPLSQTDLDHLRQSARGLPRVDPSER